MQAYELADLAINNQIRLDTAWVLFLSINSSLIGGLVFIERKFKLFEKAVIIAIYSVLIILNYSVVKNSVDVLRQIYSDFAKFQFSPEQPGYDLVNYYSQLTEINVFINYPILIPLVYFGAALLVILVTIFDEKLFITKVKKSKLD